MQKLNKIFLKNTSNILYSLLVYSWSCVAMKICVNCIYHFKMTQITHFLLVIFIEYLNYNRWKKIITMLLSFLCVCYKKKLIRNCKKKLFCCFKDGHLIFPSLIDRPNQLCILVAQSEKCRFDPQLDHPN